MDKKKLMVIGGIVGIGIGSTLLYFGGKDASYINGIVGIIFNVIGAIAAALGKIKEDA